MSKSKTRKEWFKRLPLQVRLNAIENVRRESTIFFTLNQRIDSLIDQAQPYGFYGTPEGLSPSEKMTYLDRSLRRKFFRDTDYKKYLDNVYNRSQEAEKYIENAKLEADEILKEMRKQKHAKYHEVLNTRNKLNNDEINELPVENTLHEDFEVGDVVELASSNQVARILEIRKKDIVISLNGRELHVKKNQLRPSLKMLPKETVTNH